VGERERARVRVSVIKWVRECTCVRVCVRVHYQCLHHHPTANVCVGGRGEGESTCVRVCVSMWASEYTCVCVCVYLFLCVCVRASTTTCRSHLQVCVHVQERDRARARMRMRVSEWVIACESAHVRARARARESGERNSVCRRNLRVFETALLCICDLPSVCSSTLRRTSSTVDF